MATSAFDCAFGNFVLYGEMKYAGTVVEKKRLCRQRARVDLCLIIMNSEKGQEQCLDSLFVSQKFRRILGTFAPIAGRLILGFARHSVTTSTTFFKTVSSYRPNPTLYIRALEFGGFSLVQSIS